MTRKYPSATVDKSLALSYLDTAASFRKDAQNMMSLPGDFSGNGIAVLCVHAAIAYGDAIAILAAGRKSKSGRHQDAAPFLASVYPPRTVADKTAIRTFQGILSRKDEVSYAGDLMDAEEAAALLKKLLAFAQWAEKAIEDLRQRA